jgi:tRNA(Ile)-lysidine synthase
MLEQFLNHIDQNRLLNKGDKVLLAISGGIDSMVMLHLFKSSGFDVGIAHCNFKMRGNESEEDAGFVRELANQYNIPFYSTAFDTLVEAEKMKLSIQMTARKLRYEWFHAMAVRHNYSVVATAHHLNDVFETILLNLVKGTGLDGLTGIPVRQKNIVRPLLFATRQQIEDYAKENVIQWREDSSNLTDHYQRNLLRHQVIPLLRQINPSLETTFADTLIRLNAGREFFHAFLKQFSIRNIYYDGKHIMIRKDDLIKHPFASVLLWELLKDLGFNFDQCVEITKTDHEVGSTYHSAAYQLTVNREEFIVSKKEDKQKLFIEIQSGNETVESGNAILNLTLIEIDKFKLKKDGTIAQLDADKIHFPLTWRNWEEGDKFVPLGMNQSKKLSDFLIDEKVSLPDKDDVTVIESDGEIVWVVGKRIGDSFKVTSQTKRALIITAKGI